MQVAWRPLVLLCATMLVAAGCSFSIGDTATNAAEDVIEGDAATQLGLTDVSADCGIPPDTEAGTTFTCTSTSNIGDIDYLATIVDDETVNVRWVNLIDDEYIAALEVAAVNALETQSNLALGLENFDCGDGPRLLPDESTVLCELTDPSNGDLYDTTLLITDYENIRFDIEVAENPR